MFKRGIFFFFFGVNVCVIKLRLFSLRCSRPAGLWSREGCSLGDVAALFVYEILWRDRICGSWWNKSLNQTKWAPLGNGKQLFEEGAMHTRVPAVYIGLRRHLRMHSSAHGGLTRSGSTFSRLTEKKCLHESTEFFKTKTISLLRTWLHHSF